MNTNSPQTHKPLFPLSNISVSFSDQLQLIWHPVLHWFAHICMDVCIDFFHSVRLSSRQE